MTYSWSSSLTNADEYFADSLPKRKGARADEWNGLENRQGCKPLGGSNPPPSAMRPPSGGERAGNGSCVPEFVARTSRC